MVAAVVVANAAIAAPTSERQSLNELRNTVVNLLQGLVDRGVLSREQAATMVADAQAKAAQAAEAEAAEELAEKDAIRVPYIPEIVKQEIRTQVANDLSKQVTDRVVERAKDEQWGVPAALPDWVKRVRWFGDVRLRGEADVYASDNVLFLQNPGGEPIPTNLYIVDPLEANDRGGIGRAGLGAFSNVSEDRQRLRARLRVGLDAELGGGFSMGLRLASGALRNPTSTNQTLGNTATRYNIGIDQAYVRWVGVNRNASQTLNVSAGRIANPWLSTELVWDTDVMFEGIAANYRRALRRDEIGTRFAFATIGAFPIEEIEAASDKWLLAAQLGMEWRFDGGSRLRTGLAYYDFRNTRGEVNAFGSTVLDYTAPRVLARGNTLIDIRNDNDTSTNLFALAADYQLANATLQYDWRLSPNYRVTLGADYVQNVGYDEAEIRARGGSLLVSAQLNADGSPADPNERNEGYQFEVGFGTSTMQRDGAWRAFLGYRYLQRDAVLDAFSDSDFRLGGTDAKGFFFGGEYSISPRVSVFGRYLSGDSIDGLPYGVDVWQLDLNTRF
jgi:hypothetical protein